MSVGINSNEDFPVINLIKYNKIKKYFLITQYFFYGLSWVIDYQFLSNHENWKNTNKYHYKIEKLKLINDKI